MVVVRELAVGLGTVLLVKHQGLVPPLGEALEIGEVSREAVRPFAVGPIAHFELKQPQVDANLKHLAAVASGDQTRLHLIGLARPGAQNGIDVLAHSAIIQDAPRRRTLTKASPALPLAPE